MSSWSLGAKAEERIMKIIREGGFDGQHYICMRLPKQKFTAQDLFGHDIVCVNESNWLLCQVKYLSSGKPAKRKEVINSMKATPMPKETKRVLARINGKTQEITWDLL